MIQRGETPMPCPRFLLPTLALAAALALAPSAHAQFRNNGIYLPQVGYMALETLNFGQQYGSTDALLFGVGGHNSIGYNFWITYRLWLGFSFPTGDTPADAPGVLTALHLMPGVRYNFLDEEVRPYAEVGFDTMWFLYTDNTNVVGNPALGGAAVFGGPRLAGGLEWYFLEEMSFVFELGAHLHLSIGTNTLFWAPGLSGLVGYTVYY